MNALSGLAAILRMVRKSLARHALSSAVTACCVALASGLTISVFVLSVQSREAFLGSGRGFDAVLGARGSATQLVLNSVFHLETSPGNLPWSMYRAMKSDPRVALAIPYAVGDNYRDFRIVGVGSELFTKYEPRPGEQLKLARGRLFEGDAREAVIGSQVAQRLGLDLGAKFNSYHGVSFREDRRHADEFEVVGVLAATGGPMAA